VICTLTAMCRNKQDGTVVLKTNDHVMITLFTLSSICLHLWTQPLDSNQYAALLQQIHQEKQYEYALCNLALERTHRKEIIQLTQDVMHCHKEFEQGLMNMAFELGLLLPVGMDSTHRERLSAIKSTNQEAFDQIYLKELLTIYKRYPEKYIETYNQLQHKSPLMEAWLENGRQTWLNLALVTEQLVEN